MIKEVLSDRREEGREAYGNRWKNESKPLAPGLADDEERTPLNSNSSNSRGLAAGQDVDD